MDDIENAKKKVMELLRSIKLLDDLKAHKEEILSLFEEMFKSAVGMLQEFFENATSLTDESLQEKMAKFQDEQFIFDRSIEAELDRIGELPGAAEYFDSFRDEMEARITPYLEEFTKQMTEILSKLMGDMMEGMMSGLGEMMGEMGESMELDFDGELGTPQEDREDLGSLNFIYDIQSLEDLKNNKDFILDVMADMLKDDLEGIQTMTEMEFQAEEIEEKMKLAERHMIVFIGEIERELDRIGTLPGASDLAELTKAELAKKLEPIISDIKKLGN
jgi:hypothetical protein